MRKLLGVLSCLAAAASLTFAAAGSASAGTGILTLVGPYSICATPKGNGTANGTIVTSWTCTGSNLQQWSYDGTYIKHVKSGKCLTPSGNASGTNGAVLTLWTCTNDSSQRFTSIDGVGSWPETYTDFGGKCITNKGDSLADGTYLTLWTCNPSHPTSQHWSAP
ncbi:RICIN domain-containing protein [Streptomyces bauhiniae]|uniref:RICIN domain-containing protein n=1 Tax=Streptomyces bauhiniae TaxID=2340725 RepID=UPI00363C3347